MITWIVNYWDAVSSWLDKLSTYNILTYITIIITIIALIYILFTKARPKKKWPFWAVLLSAVVIDYILISSYYDSFNKAVNPKDAWSLISSSLLFLLELCLKSLLCFLLYSFIKAGIQSESINEFAAKFFGLEIQFKKNSEKIDSALNDMLESKKQMNFVADLNKYTLELISSDFEENILNADNVNERIRENIEGILEKVYLNTKVKYYVIPVTQSGYESLSPNLARLVRYEYNNKYDRVTILKNRIGIGTYRAGGGENDTAILIDTREENYTLTPVEMSAVSNLYISMATIISWAQLVNREN